MTAITHTAGAASSSGADDGVKQTTTPAEATSSREIEGVGTVGGEEAGHGVTAKVRVDLVASTWTRSLWRTVPSRILMARGLDEALDGALQGARSVGAVVAGFEDGLARGGSEQEGERRVAASLTHRLRLACEAGGQCCVLGRAVRIGSHSPHPLRNWLRPRFRHSNRVPHQKILCGFPDCLSR